MRNVCFLAITVAQLALLLSTGHAELEKDDLAAVYEKLAGADVCPEELEFRGDDADFSAESVYTDGTVCSGSGQLVVTANEDIGPFPAYLKNESDVFGDWYYGVTASPIECSSNFSITGFDEVIWMSPEESHTITWEPIYRDAPEADKLVGGFPDKSELQEDRRYVLLGNRCFYSTKGAPCFSGSANVRLEDGTTKTMDSLSTGDVVQSDTAGAVSPILAWTHKGERISTRFVNATTSFGSLVATVGHYVFVYTDDRTELIRMKDLTVGMNLVHESGAPAPIVSISKFFETGVWNPQTQSGTIVVDGFVASCYTEVVAPRAAHALLAPVRAAASVGLAKLWGLSSSFVSGGHVFV